MRDSARGYSILSVILAILVVLVIAGVSSLSVYSWQHQKVSTLNTQVGNLNAKVAQLNSQLSNLSGQITNTCKTTPNAACAGYHYVSQKGVTIMVFAPAKNSILTSPVAIVGEVPGSWSFEAQFPIQLKDSSGLILSRTSAHLIGNWQTSQLVPFTAQLTFSGAQSGNGSIILQKDNPSGLATNEDSLIIPIKL